MLGFTIIYLVICEGSHVQVRINQSHVILGLSPGLRRIRVAFKADSG